MKSILLMIGIVISFSLGITAYIWDQLAVAIAFSIIIPVCLLYLIISGRYKKESKTPEKKKMNSAVDNYFHPVDK